MNAPGLGGEDFLKDMLLTFIMKARILNPSHNITGKTSEDEKAHSIQQSTNICYPYLMISFRLNLSALRLEINSDSFF